MTDTTEPSIPSQRDRGALDMFRFLVYTKLEGAVTSRCTVV